MEVWQARLNSIFAGSFLLLHMHLKANKIKLPDNINICITKRLKIVRAKLRPYFNNTLLPVLWHKDPFNAEVDPMAEVAQELAKFKVSNTTQQAFNSKSDPSSFWLSLYDSYPVLSKTASIMVV